MNWGCPTFPWTARQTRSPEENCSAHGWLPNWGRPLRRPVHPGRTHDGAAPFRHGPPAAGAPNAAQPGQYGACRGTRRTNSTRCGPPGGHGSGLRSQRRPYPGAGFPSGHHGKRRESHWGMAFRNAANASTATQGRPQRPARSDTCEQAQPEQYHATSSAGYPHLHFRAVRVRQIHPGAGLPHSRT